MTTDDVPDTPAAADLLDIARKTLVDRLLPQLPPAAHYDARMIANAMAIAAREIAATVRAGAVAGNPAVAAESVLPAAAAGIDDRVALAHAIRAGLHDADDVAAATHAALVADARARVAISNPRALEG